MSNELDTVSKRDYLRPVANFENTSAETHCITIASGDVDDMALRTRVANSDMAAVRKQGQPLVIGLPNRYGRPVALSYDARVKVYRLNPYMDGTNTNAIAMGAKRDVLPALARAYQIED